jgi:hypothetical protein
MTQPEVDFENLTPVEPRPMQMVPKKEPTKEKKPRRSERDEITFEDIENSIILIQR